MFLAKKHGVNVTFLSQIVLPCLPDTWMMLQEQYRDMLCLSCVVVLFFSYVPVATVDVCWVEFFLSAKLQQGYVD